MLHSREDYKDRIIDTADLIPEDEPVFLLRGKDVFAPGLLLDYAKLLRLSGGSPEMAEGIESHAQKMLEYQRSHPEIMLRDGRVKMPDMPEEWTVEKLESEPYQAEGSTIWSLGVLAVNKRGLKRSFTREVSNEADLDEIKPGYKFKV